jgi:hypothetical protein
VLSGAMGEIGPLVTGRGQQQLRRRQRRRIILDLPGGAADDMRGVEGDLPGH